MARTGSRASAVIIQNGKILLIHRKKEGEEYWVLPGGLIEDGEAPQDAGIREVKEETSLKVTKFKLWFKENFEFRDKDRYNYLFVCHVDGNDAVLGGEEAKTNSERDWYHLEWINLISLSEHNLLPVTVKTRVMEQVWD